jgi:hypothetical protein
MRHRQFKTGGVSQCWHCSRQLVRIKGGFLYVEVQDPIGNRMRVHKDCAPLAVADGDVKLVKAAA